MEKNIGTLSYSPYVVEDIDKFDQIKLTPVTPSTNVD